MHSGCILTSNVCNEHYLLFERFHDWLNLPSPRRSSGILPLIHVAMWSLGSNWRIRGPELRRRTSESESPLKPHSSRSSFLYSIMASEKSAVQTMSPAGDKSIFRRKCRLTLPLPTRSNPLSAEPNFARYIPGGYSPSRCMKLRGRAITFAILAFAGCAITFFGYDTAVMSQVNTNENYLHRMGVASGSDRDAAAIGGLVSLWFGGFAIGMIHAFLS